MSHFLRIKKGRSFEWPYSHSVRKARLAVSTTNTAAGVAAALATLLLAIAVIVAALLLLAIAVVISALLLVLLLTKDIREYRIEDGVVAREADVRAHGFTSMQIPVRIPQRVTPNPPWESQKGLLSLDQSTRRTQ